MQNVIKNIGKNPCSMNPYNRFPLSISRVFGYKDSANREQNHQACLSVMPRCSLSYAKIVQIESISKSKLVLEICFCLPDAAYLSKCHTIIVQKTRRAQNDWTL